MLVRIIAVCIRCLEQKMFGRNEKLNDKFAN